MSDSNNKSNGWETPADVVGVRFDVGDNLGWVELLDFMPHPSTGVNGDLAIVNAARVSFLGDSKGYEKDKKLLFYLLRNQHMTPFEMVRFKLRLRAPVVVWWQWVRHRAASYNLQSGRYTPFREEDFYIPKVWRKQSSDNKQGSDGVLNEDDYHELDATIFQHPDLEDLYIPRHLLDEDDNVLSMMMNWYARVGYALYDSALSQGVAKEQARLFLPGFACEYTGIVSVDARNLMHFLSLRMAGDAQSEIREYARVIYDEIFKPMLPVTAEAFAEYYAEDIADE